MGYIKRKQRSKKVEKSLVVWIWDQRKFYKRNKLSHDIIKNLEQLPNWTWYPKLGRHKNNA
jgi:hypothetical protein